MNLRRWTNLFCLGVLSSVLGLASGTASWEMTNFSDFIKGRLTGLSLSRDGRLSLAPKLEPFFESDQPQFWSVAQAPDGSIYLGTGHRGRVYHLDSKGKATIVWTAAEPEIFAIATGPDGAIYAGTSPDGKVYRIQNGKAAQFFDPQSRYIWALAFGADGALYVATGDAGKIFRVDSAGRGEVYYDTGQGHVTCLLPQAQGTLLAGTEPNGILYRISAKDKAFVLYDANLPEIRAVASAPDGSVYAAALGGSAAQKAGAAAAAQGAQTSQQVTTPVTSITVTDEAQAGLELKPKPTDPSKAAAAVQPGMTVYSAATDAAAANVEKSALYKINPDNTVETLWTSREENVYDVLLSGGTILFSTDNNGRIYRLTPDRRVTLVLQTNEGETTRLIPNGDSLLAATGSMGKLFKIGNGYAPAGVYESPVHDAGTIARWGQISWRGERKGNSRLAFRTRSGNSARPDRTWSDWSTPLSEPAGINVNSPNARFIQWKAEMAASTAAESPSLTSVTLTYLPQNNPPAVRSINVITTLAPVASGSKPAAPAASTYSITVTDTGEAGASSLSGTPAQTIARGLVQQIQISWAADDPDGDKLAFSLYFKGDEEAEWKLLRGNFPEMSFTADGDIFADGKYLFRVAASDRPSNSATTARDSDLTSAPIVFDNTPPVVTAQPPRVNGQAVEIVIDAADVSSGLRRAEYSLDATHWVPLESADGVIDGLKEQFVVRLENLTQGEHLVVVRAFDSSNNAGLTKIVTRVPVSSAPPATPQRRR